MRKKSVLFGVMLVALVASASAQTGTAHPGYYPIEELGIFAQGTMEVDIDVSGAMLQVAAGAMENQDESLAELVSNLERIRVQVGAPKNVDASAVGASIAGNIDPRTLGRLISSIEDFDLEEIMGAMEQ